jgi:hypothetical protein
MMTQKTNISPALIYSTVEDRLFWTISTELMKQLWFKVEDGLENIILTWAKQPSRCSKDLRKCIDSGWMTTVLWVASSIEQDSQLLPELMNCCSNSLHLNLKMHTISKNTSQL